MPKIYESPDKGKTVYAREIGAPFESRVLQTESEIMQDELEPLPLADKALVEND